MLRLNFYLFKYKKTQISMKVSIKNSILSLAITSSILMSCQKDQIVEDPTELQIGQFETEVFDELTTKEYIIKLL